MRQHYWGQGLSHLGALYIGELDILVSAVDDSGFPLITVSLTQTAEKQIAAQEDYTLGLYLETMQASQTDVALCSY